MKLSTVRFTILAGIFIVLNGCALGQIRDYATPEQLKEVESSRVYANTPDEVWMATMKMLATKGASPTNQDKSSGMITSGWIVTRNVFGTFQTGQRLRGIFFIEALGPNETKVTLTPNFQLQLSKTTEWRDSQRAPEQIHAERQTFDELQLLL